MKKFLPLLMLFFVLGSLQAQERYLDEVFTDVEVTADVTYGVNATVLFLSVAMQAVPEALKLDIYEPAGDTETQRPLVLMFHTGNIIPPSFNGGCTGTRKDADIVHMATRLAKMGYVAAICSYRLGWDPSNSDQNVRVYTLINAAYRGVQDCRTATRFFKKTAAEDGNPYGIDPDKVAIWGNGTGGYITYGSATLDTITDTWIPGKFVTPAGPMIVEQFNGNLQGTTYGVIPPTGVPGLPFPPNDTLCYPNWVGYDDEIKLSVSLGGANGDTSWLDANDPPLIGMQVPTDPFAPYFTDVLIVPPPLNLPVVEVSGAGDVLPIANNVGMQGPIDHPFIDPISQYAASVNGGNLGLYPFFSSDPTESAQWNYSASAEPYGVSGSNCNVDSAAAFVYIDTIMTFFAPRACLALGLNCNLDGYSATNDLLDAAEVGLKIAPNPATEVMRFATNEQYPIEHIYVYDTNGRLVMARTNVNSNQFTMERHSLISGQYYAQFRFKKGVVTQPIIFR